MSSYPNILTPPSSLEDSPQSVYLVSSPGSNTFEYDNYEYPPIQAVQAPYIVKPNISIDPNLIKLEIKPSLRFVEQPTDRFRFRYKSEMAGTHGSLTGINSDKSRKPTYPTVELKHCTGRVTVRCSIYQSNANGQDNLPHAHRLIMKKGKEEHDDPHDIMVGPEDGYRAVFQGMGIIHTAKKNIVSELMRKKVQLKREFNARTENKIRDLTTKEQVEIKGLAESESKSINLNIVCLRFDAFIDKDGILFPICEPIFSHGINNLKSALTGDLKIVRLDHVVGEAKGNQEIFILVERVTKKNIKIRFYEVDDEDRVVWEDWGRFNDLDVHHQYAIVFKTPKYRDENIRAPVEVFIELVRPTDGARSEPRDFRYIPNKNKAGQKRPRYDYSSSSRESSNVASDEIPVFINNLQIGNNQNPNISPLSNAPSGVSEEIRKAMNNIHSDEFKKLFTENEDTFTVFYEEMDFASIATDNTWGSSNQIVAQGGEEIFDHQMARSEIAVPEMDSRMVIVESPSWEFIKIEVTKEEKLKAIKDVDELRSFIRTTHKTHVAVEMLNYYFGKDERTNALHVSICQRDNKSALLLLKMMAYYKQLHLLDKTNNNKQTPLHLAVLCFNGPIIRSLLMCKVRMSAMDNSLNTPLHLAVKSNASIEVLKMLLKNRDCEGIKEYIDMENEHGDTALLIAIDKKNIVAIQVLCDSGADVNKIHPKNGYVPLRFAIEKKHVDIVKYLLSLNYVNATIKDFQNMSPLAAAFGKEMDLEITKAVQKYMNNNNVVLDIKEEPEDDSESEMEMDEEIEVKSEFPRLSPDELEKLYEDVKEFTPQCLNTVSAILDKSESWKHLAELLQIEHLINSGIIVSDLSMSKALLIYSIETNRDSVWMIRNFLENLDEHKAVEIIDRMVQEMKTC